MSMVVEELECD